MTLTMPLNDNDAASDVDDVSMDGVDAPVAQGGGEEEEGQKSEEEEGLEMDPVRGAMFFPHG